MADDTLNGFACGVLDRKEGRSYYAGKDTTPEFSEGYSQGWKWYEANEERRA